MPHVWNARGGILFILIPTLSDTALIESITAFAFSIIQLIEFLIVVFTFSHAAVMVELMEFAKFPHMTPAASDPIRNISLIEFQSHPNTHFTTSAPVEAIFFIVSAKVVKVSFTIAAPVLNTLFAVSHKVVNVSLRISAKVEVIALILSHTHVTIVSTSARLVPKRFSIPSKRTSSIANIICAAVVNTALIVSHALDIQEAIEFQVSEVQVLISFQVD